ncbi:MAG: ABC transporter ATP-binding protein [Actinomycetota bacterium]
MVMIGTGGPFFAGPSATSSSSAAGLPFAGVPDELRQGAERILASEPEHELPRIGWDPAAAPGRLTLRSLLAPERVRIALAVVLVVIETVAGLAGPLLTAIAIDRGVSEQRPEVIGLMAGLYVVSVLVQGLANGVRLALTGRIAEQILEGLRIRVFSHLQRQSVDFFTRERSGVLLSRMTSDIDALSALLQEGYVNLVVQGLTVVLVTAVLIGISPLLAGLLLLVVVPVFLALTWWFRGASTRAFGRVRDRIADVLADLQEHLAGIRVVTAANRRRHNGVVHREVVGRYRDASLDSARISSTYGPAAEVTGLLGQAAVLLIGGNLVLDGDLTIGELTAFVLYLTTFFAPIQQLVQLYTVYQQGSAALHKLSGVLETEPTVVETPGAAELPPIDGLVELDHVTFAYSPGEPVLHDVSLTIRPGETVALVGPTGAGKSTIAKLVTRFHDPVSGAVRIDGTDLRTVTLRSLRGQLGIVPQEPFLFHGTLRDNIGYGRPDASDDELLAACEAVGLGELVARTEAGLDAAVHERGVSLSAGERQLLALARAFLDHPRVLILDEATSNLDLESETKVERALDTVLDGTTAILIAHRLATAMRADRIGVVDGGRIVELGSHDQLVELGGRYTELHRAWIAAGGADRPTRR